MATIQINMNPSMLEENPAGAVSAILREIADRIDKGERRFTADDVMGARAAKVKAEDIPGGRRVRR